MNIWILTRHQPSTKAHPSSNLFFLVTQVVVDSWFCGQRLVMLALPRRVCTAPHFHWFCWTSSTEDYLTVSSCFCHLYSAACTCTLNSCTFWKKKPPKTSPANTWFTGASGNNRKMYIFRQPKWTGQTLNFFLYYLKKIEYLKIITHLYLIDPCGIFYWILSAVSRPITGPLVHICITFTAKSLYVYVSVPYYYNNT